MGALFVILLPWAIFRRHNIIASAGGKRVPQTYGKIVRAADSCIVREMRVKEGETIKAGQVLMRMDMKVARTASDRAQREYDPAKRSTD